jgi:SNF family Na+-dependent transporter
LPVIPAFFVSIIVYIITTNGFLAGISLLLVTSILQLKSW